MSLCWMSHFLIVMLNVIMLSVIMLNVTMLNVIMLNIIMLNVIMLNVKSLCWMSCHYAECHVIMLNGIMLNGIMLNVIVLNLIMLNDIMLNVVAPCQGIAWCIILLHMGLTLAVGQKLDIFVFKIFSVCLFSTALYNKIFVFHKDELIHFFRTMRFLWIESFSGGRLGPSLSLLRFTSECHSA